MADAALAPAPTGLVLGRYRPLRPLGSGGSGSVWLARDEGSGLDVALKIVARDGKAAARAEREAEAAARLRHERCLRAYGLSHDEDHVYIAYEYVPGRTARDAMRAGEVDDAGAVELAAQLLEGLAHAHRRGIIHRDVKPSNVLLADGEGISVRLLDFGLARMDEAATLTATGDVPGTLAYIAPERLSGEPGSAASDVWAVGVILWEALAGGHPFWKSSLLDSARAIEAGAPPLRTMRPDLPDPLLSAVDRALSSDPRRRPDAARLATQLREAAAPRGRRPIRRRPPPALAGRAGAAAGAALIAGWTASALPFYPAGAAPALAAIAAAATLARPSIGLAVTLAVPILPLGNVALGLALLYAAVAAAWLGLFAREPAGGLLPALGALLGPVSALGLLPLAVTRLQSGWRRAAAAGGAVLIAAIAAGTRGVQLPFTGAPAPDFDVAGSERPDAVAEALWSVLSASPPLWREALVLAAAAAALPLAVARGAWWIAGWGAAALAAALLVAPAVAAPPLVLAIWGTCAVAVAREEVASRKAA